MIFSWQQAEQTIRLPSAIRLKATFTSRHHIHLEPPQLPCSGDSDFFFFFLLLLSRSSFSCLSPSSSLSSSSASPYSAAPFKFVSMMMLEYSPIHTRGDGVVVGCLGSFAMVIKLVPSRRSTSSSSSLSLALRSEESTQRTRQD